MSFMSFSESLYDSVFRWASELVFCVVPRKSDEESYELTYTLCTPLFAWFEYAFHHNRYLTSYSIYELSCIIPYTGELQSASEQSATFYSLHAGLDEYRRTLFECASLSDADNAIMLQIQQLLHCPSTEENKSAIRSCFQYYSSINVHYFTQDGVINFQLPPDLAPNYLAQINEAITNSQPINKPNTENLLVSLFDYRLQRCCSILKCPGSSYTPEHEYDLYVVACVISDFAIAMAGKDRARASNDILGLIYDALSSLSPNHSSEYFSSRMDFYAEVVRGTPLHAHCLPGVDLSDANPISRCAIAFCDCLMNPMYIEDYGDYWPPTFSALESLNIATNIFKPLNSELAALYNDMYTLACSFTH